MSAPRVTTHAVQRKGKAKRWAYQLHIPGQYPFASAFRWASEAAAREAGEKDLAATLAYLLEQEQKNETGEA